MLAQQTAGVRHAGTDDGSAADAAPGRITHELLPSWSSNTDYAVRMKAVGAFLSRMLRQLLTPDLPESSIQYECFGPP